MTTDYKWYILSVDSSVLNFTKFKNTVKKVVRCGVKVQSAMQRKDWRKVTVTPKMCT